MGKSLINVLNEKISKNSDIAQVVITKAEGSSPRGVGSMMLVDAAGAIVGGTVGGGAVEEQARRDAAESIRRGRSCSFHYKMDALADAENSLPMLCGGDIEVFINVFNSREKLLIVGAGHIGLNLYNLARMLNYYVVIIDNRAEFAGRDRFPEADEVLAGDIARTLAAYPVDEKTSIVIVTHGHEYDETALEQTIAGPARYIGMIGSAKKIEACFQSLWKKGIAPELTAKVHAPIGLDIGGEKPEEIALAIMAEIQAVRYQRQGGFLK